MATTTTTATSRKPETSSKTATLTSSPSVVIPVASTPPPTTTTITAGSDGSSGVRTMTTFQIIFCLPNLIGYTRIILAFMACTRMHTNPNQCMFLYALSCLLDAFDGYAARLLNQCTRLGAVLDMVTDRFTTACLLVMLAHLYSRYMVIFQLLTSLDLASHYIRMYSALILGATSHKTIDRQRNWLLRHYYGSRTMLFLMCAGNEVFFMCLYMWHSHVKSSRSFTLGSWAQLLIIRLFQWDLLSWLTCLSFPVCFLKQWINLVQFLDAAKALIHTEAIISTGRYPLSLKGKHA
jgi:CDP-diacylglycerol--inositol 3-phosphatidyltransferase